MSLDYVTRLAWVFLGVSSQWGMPETPPEGGVHRASDTDARATSAGSSPLSAKLSLHHDRLVQ